MRGRVTFVAVWVVVLGALVGMVAFVVHMTAVSREGSRVVAVKAVPSLHLNAQGHLVQGDGAQVVFSKTMKGWVEREVLGHQSVRVQGWAGDKETGVPARTIVVLVNGRFAAKGPTGGIRPDVARAFNHQNLDHSGFDVTVAPLDVSPAARAKIVLTVYALNTNGAARELEYTPHQPLTLGHP